MKRFTDHYRGLFEIVFTQECRPKIKVDIAEKFKNHMSKKAILPLLMGIAVSALACYFSFRHIPVAELVQYSREINYLAVLPSAAVLWMGFCIRAARWQLLLNPAMQIPYLRVYHPLMIGFMLNCILPARIGEIARPAMLKKKEHISFAAAAATIVSERLLDLVFLLLFFIVILHFVAFEPGMVVAFGGYTLEKDLLIKIFTRTSAIAALAGVMVVVLGFEGFRTRCIRLITRMVAYIPFIRARLKERGITELSLLLQNISTGFAFVKNPYAVFMCAAYSILVWGCAALSQYIMVLGSPGIDVNFLESFAVLIIVCFFVSLPSVPGYWGVWEAGGVFALSLFGISGAQALGFTLVNHMVQIFPVILAGMVSLFLYSGRTRKTERQTGSPIKRQKNTS
jgi:glycosyltransferase 2 family protein